MAYNLQLPGGMKPTNPVPVDGYYNNGGVPYVSVAEACTLVPRPVRNAGQTVLVGDTEYWWLAGNLGDSGLVVKTVANPNGVGGGGAVIPTTYANALNLIAQNQLVPGGNYKFSDFPTATAPVYITALDKGVFATTAYQYDGTNVQQYLVNVPAGSMELAAATGNEPVFQDDFVVSQTGGHTLGRFQDGDTVPAKGKTAVDVLLLAAIDSKYPTYQPAAIGVGMSASPDGEVGETVNNSVQAQFSANDAGALTNLSILRNGALLGAVGHSSPVQAVDSTVRVLGTISYQATADYTAGAVKNVQPANTPDPRAAQIRSPYAPQAAENGFRSGVIGLNGFYRIFYGPVDSNPANSADGRALAGSRLTNAGNQFVLDTGATKTRFAILLPPGRTLQSVIDADALNADITSEYHVSDLTVNDAGGNPVNYKLYVMSQASPYSSSHRHVVTIG